METMPKDIETPIQQDDKHDLPRFIKIGNYPYTYGMFPRTWESGWDADPWTQIPGDTDPMDAIEISGLGAVTGGVYQVKILGGLAMIDDGETDWKIITLSTESDLPYERYAIIRNRRYILVVFNYNYDCRKQPIQDYDVTTWEEISAKNYEPAD
eukprot:UN29124